METRPEGADVTAEDVGGPQASRAGRWILVRFLLNLLSGKDQTDCTLGKTSSGTRPRAIIQGVLMSFLRQKSPARIPGRTRERVLIISILMLAALPLKKKMTSSDYLILGQEYRALNRLAPCLEFKYKSH